MPQPRVSKKLVSQATFTFRGTVMKLKASTMKVVPATKNTIVVRVDEVIEAQEALEDYEGQRVTVELPRPGKIKVGQQYTFYTNGWLFGDSLAVQALAYEEAPTAIAAAAAVRRPSANLRNKLARARFDSADLVITGVVTQVRVPPEVATLAAALPAPTWKPISEHDPVIQEAVIDVTGVQKGTPGGAQVTLRFPRST